MLYIDRYFNPDEPVTWFKHLFPTKHFDIQLCESHEFPIGFSFEQILFDYSNHSSGPSDTEHASFRMQLHWSKGSAPVVVNHQHGIADTPLMTELSNKIANHWAIHWIHFKQALLAPGSIPESIATTERVINPTTYTFWIVDRETNQEVYLSIVLIGHVRIGAYSHSSFKKALLDFSFFDNLQLPIGVLNAAGEVVHLNKKLGALEPDLKKKTLPLPWEMLFYPDWLHEAWEAVAYYARATYISPWSKAMSNVATIQKGTYSVILQPLNDGAVLQLAPLSNVEIDQLKSANYDRITGLLTRDRWLQEQRSSNTDEGWLVLVGIDGIKNINATLGNSIGDLYIAEVAQRLQNAFPSQRICRWNGDEFLMFIPGSKEKEPDLSFVFSDPIWLSNTAMQGSACVGIAYISKDDFIIEHTTAVESALSEAKNIGPGSHLLAVEKHSAEYKKQKFLIELNLNKAIERQELFVHYQPILNLDSKKVVSLEALMRWAHPEYGYVGPQHFIPIAERKGSIAELTAWIITTSCGELGHIVNAREIDVSINLSPLQLYNSTLLNDILHILKETSFPSQRLKLELTEGISLDSSRIHMLQIEELSRLGIRFAIDDFGAGYTAISQLKTLPVYQLKLDKTYIHQLQDDHYYTLVKNLIDLAHNMGLTVVAEGVETLEQEVILKELRCDYVQGFLYCKPLPIHELDAYLNRKP